MTDRPTRHRAGPRAHRPDRWLAPQRGSLGESGQRQPPRKPLAGPEDQSPRESGDLTENARPDEATEKLRPVSPPARKPRPSPRPRGQARPEPAATEAIPPPPLPPPGGRPPRRPTPPEPRTQLISRAPEPPTEVIQRVDDDGYYDEYDEYDQYDDEYYEDYYDEGDYYDEEPPKDKVSAFAKTAGELLLTAGMVVLLFVVYEVWVTDLISAGKQADATEALDKQWNSGTVDGRTEHLSPADGQGIAKLYIPALGQDYKFTVIEGTTDADLAIGPGHYTDSQQPGEPGNFAVAGHRVGKGAPFNDLDLVQPCDAIIVETRADWYVYRMLPLDEQARTWPKVVASNPLCAGSNGEKKVVPLTGPYTKTTGRAIVDPSAGEVVDPIPYEPDSAVAAKDRKPLLTLTTCHPKFSNKQRMIVQAILVKRWAKAELGGKPPVEMNEVNG